MTKINNEHYFVNKSKKIERKWCHEVSRVNEIFLILTKISSKFNRKSFRDDPQFLKYYMNVLINYFVLRV